MDDAKLAAAEHHIIQGTTHYGMTFRCPLVTHVQDNLWIGGKPHEMPGYFKNVLNLYPWEFYSTEKTTHVRKVEMYDSIEKPIDDALIGELTDWVLRKLKDGPVLVHCQCGLNRSGLIVANTLIRRGLQPQEAIDLLQAKRDAAVLCNPRFTDWLLQQTAPTCTCGDGFRHTDLDCPELFRDRTPYPTGGI